MHFTHGLDTAGNISFSDNYSEIAYVNFNDYSNYGVSSSAIGVCATTSNGYTNFDVLLNSQKTWGDNPGISENIAHKCGVLTHELGHAQGLGDVYTVNISGIGELYCTMYAYGIITTYMEPFPGQIFEQYLNVTSTYPTLEPDDINGKTAVVNMIP